MSIVSDYFSFQNGYAFKSKDFVKDGKYAIIRIKELKDGGVKFFEDTASTTANFLKAWSFYGPDRHYGSCVCGNIQSLSYS